MIQKKISDHKLHWIVRLSGLGLCLLLLFAFFSLHTKKQPDFSSFCEQIFREQLAGDTISLHYTLADPKAFGITDDTPTLGSPKESDIAQTHLSCENLRHALSGYDYDALTRADRLTYDILQYTIDQSEEGCRFYYYDEPLNPISGMQAELPVLLAEYTFRSAHDVENYLALIARTPECFADIIDFEEKKSAQGLYMPTYATDAIQSQLASLLAPPSFACLRDTFSDKLDTVIELDEPTKAAYRSEHESLIERCLVPAYTSLQEALFRLRDTTKQEGGLCELPQGDDYYSYLVKKSTASNRPVDELHVMISEKRQENISELAQIIKTDNSILSRMSNVKLTWKTPEEMLEHLKSRMSSDFPAAPDNAYTVKTVTPSMQDFLSPAFYLTAPMDDPDDNHIYINPAGQRTPLELFTTLAHEGYPGHLYETVCSYGQDLSPLRHILSFGGYTEGWATYVEMCSYDYAGLDETLARALQLNAAATLSLYASIDIGVHHEHWDRDVVHEFLCDYGITSETASERIYELVVETPANYLKYYVGYLEFLELKKDAGQRFGSDYNDISFHQALLAIGPAPFHLIRQYLPYYYKSA